ncbi:MAG: phage/plasmid primase, P4 family [Gemmatimonadetes bacterium]|nr:phage/plasmid primase, P4 family [Gemmatimonadota bacterium]
MSLLSPSHRQNLHESGISDDVIARRGYETIDEATLPHWRKKLRETQFKQSVDDLSPGIFIPRFDKLSQVEGSRPAAGLAQIRFDAPGDGPKYLSGRSVRALDWMQLTPGEDALLSGPLLLVEGVKKSDALRSSLWKRGELGTVIAVPDCSGCLVAGRKKLRKDIAGLIDGKRLVLWIPDADVTSNKDVWKAGQNTLDALHEVDPKAAIVILPRLPDDPKAGLDDLLAAGRDWHELARNTRTVMPDPPEVVRSRGVAVQAQGELAALYADRKMAHSIARDLGTRLRFGRHLGRALHFQESHFEPLSSTLAQDLVGERLAKIADEIAMPATFEGTAEERRALQKAIHLCQHNLLSTGKARAVLQQVSGLPGLQHDEAAMRVPDNLWPMPNGQTLDLSDLSRTETTPEMNPYFIGGVIPAEGPTPHWDAFRSSISHEDDWVGDAVDECMGYAMQGRRAKQACFAWLGDGRNGKGTVIRVAQRVFGSFFLAASHGTFFADDRQSDRHDAHLLQHIGRRLVVSSDPSGRPKETMLLSYVGGDQIIGEQKGGESLAFTPTAALLLNGQADRLRLDGLDVALTARMRVCPFRVSFAGREDEQLLDALLSEAPAIAFRWAERARDFLARGVLDREQLQREQAQLFAEEKDVVGRFLYDRCTADANGGVRSADLRRAWEQWADEEGEPVRTAMWLAQQLKRPREGWKIAAANSGSTMGRHFKGLRLRNGQ